MTSDLHSFLRIQGDVRCWVSSKKPKQDLIELSPDLANVKLEKVIDPSFSASLGEFEVKNLERRYKVPDSNVWWGCTYVYLRVWYLHVCASSSTHSLAYYCVCPVRPPRTNSTQTSPLPTLRSSFKFSAIASHLRTGRATLAGSTRRRCVKSFVYVCMSVCVVVSLCARSVCVVCVV